MLQHAVRATNWLSCLATVAMPGSASFVLGCCGELGRCMVHWHAAFPPAQPPYAPAPAPALPGFGPGELFNVTLTPTQVSPPVRLHAARRGITCTLGLGRVGNELWPHASLCPMGIICSPCRSRKVRICRLLAATCMQEPQGEHVQAAERGGRCCADCQQRRLGIRAPGLQAGRHPLRALAVQHRCAAQRAPAHWHSRSAPASSEPCWSKCSRGFKTEVLGHGTAWRCAQIVQ